MLKRSAVAVLVVGALIAAWQYGTEQGAPSEENEIALPRRPSAESIRALAPSAPLKPDEPVAVVQRPAPVATVAKRTSAPRPRSSVRVPVSAIATPTPTAPALIPVLKHTAAKPTKKSSKWVRHLSGREAYFTVEESKLKTNPCHGGFGDSCARPSDDKDLKVVGVIVETDEGRPVQDTILEGQVQKGSYYENTPVVYVK